MKKAIAISNSHLAQLFWSYDAAIPNCLGFKIERIEQPSGATTVLPAWVGFKGENNTTWRAKDTSVWPVQEFNWRDLTATTGKTYTYRITPMTGTPGNLTASTDTLETNAVTLSPEIDKNFRASFTNGILATQALSHYIDVNAKGAAPSTFILDNIQVPGNDMRKQLSGEAIPSLTQLIDLALRDGGTIYAALYELEDNELITALLSLKGQLKLILSNTGTNEKLSQWDNTNKQPSKDVMAAALGQDFRYRVVPNNHIGHNKFLLYVDKDGTPVAVLSGSTNWTVTGLCTQSNNQLVINSPEVGKFYLDYWNRLLEDTDNSNSQQAEPLRTADNNNGKTLSAKVGSSTVDIWHSPNTKLPNKPPQAPTPSDLAEVFELMSQAKQAIIFLVFQPGTPSILDQAYFCQQNNPHLFVRGAATDPQAVDTYEVDLHHLGVTPNPDTVAAATAINSPFADWEKELLKTAGAHAIIHDKIVVIDPFSDDCVVITGSHNLGFKASYANDENMVIVRGNKALASAYTAHILDVYHHYRFRFQQQENAKKGVAPYDGLNPSASWQDIYFKNATTQMLQFWATLPVPAGKAATAPLASGTNVMPAGKKAPVTKGASKSAPKKVTSPNTAKKATPTKAVKKVVPKKAVKKAAPKKVTAKKAVKKAASKVSKKVTAKKVLKKAAPKKVAAKKAVKKAAPKKAAPKAAKKATSKKVAPKKAVTKGTKKATPKKVAAKKIVKKVAKKTAPTKSVKKVAPKKAVKKTATKRGR